MNGKKRVVAFIDGFNLYHSLKDLREPHLKWLDLWALCKRFISTQSERLEAVYYFSAYATWLPDEYKRHRVYIAALQAAGVRPVMGKFKEKDRYCSHCKSKWKGHEEKETDVNLALALLNGAYRNEYDKALVVTRDSDIAPAIRMARNLFPEKELIVIAPPGRGHSTELVQAATDTRKITKSQVAECSFPEVVVDAGGNEVARRPETWR